MSTLLPCPLCGATAFEEHESMIRCACGLRLDVNSMVHPYGEKERRWNTRPVPASDALVLLSKMADDAQKAEDSGYGLEWDGAKLAAELRGIVASLKAERGTDALRELLSGARQDIADGDYNFADTAIMAALERLGVAPTDPPAPTNIAEHGTEERK